MYLNSERKPNCYPISAVGLEGCLNPVDKTRNFGKSKEVMDEHPHAWACIHLLGKVKLLCLHSLYSTHFSLIL